MSTKEARKKCFVAYVNLEKEGEAIDMCVENNLLKHYDEAVNNCYEACEGTSGEYNGEKCGCIDAQVLNELRELKAYREAEEQRLLLRLPCKVGDTVWFIRNKEIIKTMVEKIGVKKSGVYIKLDCNAMYETSCSSIGKTVFLTKAEAEAALTKRKGV
jgi:hypothetical protein